MLRLLVVRSIGIGSIAGGLLVTALEALAQDDHALRARLTRASKARSQLAELFAMGEVEGRLGEPVAGSYVFAPRGLGLPQAPVANPDKVSALAVGPVLLLRGRVDSEGRLTVESYSLKPPPRSRSESGDGLPPAVRNASAEIVSALGDAIKPGAMSVVERSLDGESAPARKARTNIAGIVTAYRAAVNAGDGTAVSAIVREWAALRPQVLDTLPGGNEYKAIYGQADNYAPWRYDRIFQQSPAVVAIGEPNGSIARCSGVLVGSDLVLTAAHCFSLPPRREPGQLEVWFDYAERPDGASPPPVQRRRIAAEPAAPAPSRWPDLMTGPFRADLLDYAIVRFAAPAGEPLLPNSARPQCLRRTPLDRGEAIYVVGYPRGERATVHDNARVYLPHRVLDGDDFSKLRLDAETDLLGDPGRAELMQEFDASYVDVETSVLGTWRVFHDVRYGLQPSMGVIADTFRGNSGGPVYDHGREQCVVGILNRGASDTGQRRSGNWKEHEHVLPIRAVLDDLKRDPATATVVDSLTIAQ